MERLAWPVSGPDAGRVSLHPAVGLFRAIVGRNHLRNRRRFVRAPRLTSQDDNVEVWEDDVSVKERGAK